MWGACAILLAASCVSAVPFEQQNHKVADKAYLIKQRDILRLFNYVNQPSYYKDFAEIADAFKFKGHWDQWSKPQHAKEFYRFYLHKNLPQGEVFSVFHPEHLEQAIALFKTFYCAKDYETFFKTAVWARQHVNEGMFVYALTLVVAHSQKNLILPPVHEILPNYFFNDEVMYKARQYKQHYWGKYAHEEEIKDDNYDGHTIHANYSGWYMNVHPEQSMTYFTEDIGINSYYYYRHIISAFWLEATEMGFDMTTRGEYFYHYHQQLLARYYLERLSNGLGEIPHFDYDYPIETGYYPSLTHASGLRFPTRPNHASLYYHERQAYSHFDNYTFSMTHVEDYERRLRDALDKGYVYTPDGEKVGLLHEGSIENFGSLVESTYSSPNPHYYGNLVAYARHLLGYSHNSLNHHKISPSALEHFETSLRDPMFWQMYKRIMSFFHQRQNYQGPYKKEDLLYDGITIEDVKVDRLMTFFEYDYSDLSNGVTVDPKEFNEETFKIRARQSRLNHKPFNYHIKIVANRATEALVKVFVGPKYDEHGREIGIQENRVNFFEIDSFHYTLQAGQNTIERNSHDSELFSPDRIPHQQLYQQILSAINCTEEFKYLEPTSKYYNFPHRYMLPKGDYGGKTYQFYVIASLRLAPATPYPGYLDPMGTFNTEYSMGYPLDRPIKFEHEFFVPNSFFKDVVIYHKNSEKDIDTNN